ncbi:MAG: DUF1579 family protein [Gemmatirosa sp.]
MTTATDPLAPLAGRWQGTNRLVLPWTTPPENDSEATAEIARVAGGRFTTVRYTWAHEGKPCEGFLLVGREPKGNVAHASWVDSWHQSARPLTCVGTVGDDGAIDVRGSYPAPEGPDWGWRIVVHAPDDAHFHITMYNVEPDGEESLAVESRYVRASA